MSRRHATCPRWLLLLACSGLAAVALGAAVPPAKTPVRLVTLEGEAVDPFAQDGAKVLVFVFVRTDCPISNRYAPRMQAIHSAYADAGVRFFLVYPDPDERPDDIRTHIREYGMPGTPLRDPDHDLVRRAGATMTPEAAVFTAAGDLIYRGRIDNRFVSYGKARPRATRTDLRDTLDALLAGKTVPFTTTPAIGCFIPDLE
ncbi:MAG: redoxin family protein [Acidobacteriota bacterium]